MTNTDQAPQAQPKRRRWLRFSLRTLLVAVTLLCIWLAMQVNAARRQREAVAAIRKVGGSVEFDYQIVPPTPGSIFDYSFDPNALPPGPAWLRERLGDEYFCRVVGVTIVRKAHTRAISASDLAELAKLPSLKILGVTDLRNDYKGPSRNRLKIKTDRNSVLINDDGLEQIGKLSSLEGLYLDRNRITDVGLKHLANLTNLEALNLNDTDISSTGLQYLRANRLKFLALQNTDVDGAGLELIGKMVSLKSLNLSGTGITDEGLKQLRGLTMLERLDLSDTDISDAGFEQIGNMTNLRNLRLDGTLISDVGLQHLKRLTNLEQLVVTGAAISDAGVKYLKGLTKLKNLELYGTRVTPKGIRELQQSLPTTRISAP